MAVPGAFSARQVEYVIEYVEKALLRAQRRRLTACSWSEARNGIHRHFGPEERNLGFLPDHRSSWCECLGAMG